MSYVNGNGNFSLQKNPSLKVPKTMEEFQKMSYPDRVQFLEEHPDAYDKFVNPKKPWEK